MKAAETLPGKQIPYKKTTVVTLQDFLSYGLDGVRKDLCELLNVRSQNINAMIKSDFILVDGQLYRKAKNQPKQPISLAFKPDGDDVLVTIESK